MCKIWHSFLCKEEFHIFISVPLVHTPFVSIGGRTLPKIDPNEGMGNLIRQCVGRENGCRTIFHIYQSKILFIEILHVHFIITRGSSDCSPSVFADIFITHETPAL